MGLFGLSREEVNRIASNRVQEDTSELRRDLYSVRERLSEERNRSRQVISILLETIPKKILDKKVSGGDIRGMPTRWFWSSQEEKYVKISVEQILKLIKD